MTDTNSILLTVKEVLDDSDEEVFDTQLIIFINAIFATLQQDGIGPAECFYIEDETSEWDEVTDDKNLVSWLKTFVSLKTKLYFDSASMSSMVADMMTKQCDELEWRMKVHCERKDA